jgi:gluconolactonase
VEVIVQPHRALGELPGSLVVVEYRHTYDGEYDPDQGGREQRCEGFEVLRAHGAEMQVSSMGLGPAATAAPPPPQAYAGRDRKTPTMPEAEITIEGLGLIEGPVWRAAHHDLIVTAIPTGRLLSVDVETATSTVFADVAGGPNGAYPCADGGVVVAQNGGWDWDAIMGTRTADPSEPTTAGLQRVYPDGRVELLTGDDGPFRAPNDLCLGPDGAVWFTDPPAFPHPPEPVGRVWRWSAGRPAEVVAEGFAYCNGIGVSADATVLVVEGRGLMRLTDRSWFVETLPGGGDGFAFDVEGNVYVAGSGAVTVVSPEGKVMEQFAAPNPGSFLTNCCFGGRDLATLYVTEANGHLLAFRDMPVPGVPMIPLSL